MRTSFLLKLTVSSLILLPAAAQAAPEAAKLAARAEKALARNKPAVALAEVAVAAVPRDAGYRMLLGRAYLNAGRFASAAASFADTLELDPTRAAAALNLSLTRAALGDPEGARAVLRSHGDLLPVGDRGMALALAGDAAGGVALLEAAVRDGLADPRTRQNLALAYALAGRWAEAKLMASYDLDPATLAQRIMEWSRLSREGQIPAQVAAMLGVQPVADAGQPVHLALRVPSAPAVKAAHAAPPAPLRMIEGELPSPPVSMVTVEPPPPVVIADPVTIVATPIAAIVAPAVQFGPRAEVVQRIFRAPPRPAAIRPVVVTARAPSLLSGARSGGRFVVQLGAFDSPGVVEAAWARTAGRISALKGFAPATSTIVRGSATFYRLSVGGFGTRSVAADLCQTLQVRGAKCFVRQAAGDVPLRWAGRAAGPRFAAR